MESIKQSHVITYRLVRLAAVHRCLLLICLLFLSSPQREERKGWLGDAALTVNEALYNFDLIKLYNNFLNSIVEVGSLDGCFFCSFCVENLIRIHPCRLNLRLLVESKANAYLHSTLLNKSLCP